jgi:hypothetical protein
VNQHVWPFRAALVGLSLLVVASAAPGQESSSPAREPSTLRAAAGEDYAAGSIRRLLVGSDYRDLWTTPIDVEVLDLGSYAGGLTPVMRVGGQQSKGLALKGADGRDYTFRGVDKDPSAILPEDLQDTVVHDFVQDQISAAHPAGSLVAEELARAAGVLVVETRFFALGDDPALGEFREDFAGTLGTLSVYPQAVSETNPGFEGATEILDHLGLYARVRAGTSDRVDDRALLRARLVDVFLGDWDRHRKQWRWAKMPGKDGWQPIPEDRDQAFSRYDGIVLGLARPRQPIFVVFGPDYPSILGLTWNGWEQDRVLLTGLEWPVWEETARDLQRRLTDEVIERAARRMPAEYFELDGERLTEALRQRREKLPEAARKYYELLAGKVDVHGTDQAEVAEIQRLPDGDLEVKLSAAGVATGEPFFARRFHPDETDEVRVFLHGGDDRVSVGRPRRLAGRGDPLLRRLRGHRSEVRPRHPPRHAALRGPGPGPPRPLAAAPRLGAQDADRAVLGLERRLRALPRHRHRLEAVRLPQEPLLEPPRASGRLRLPSEGGSRRLSRGVPTGELGRLHEPPRLRLRARAAALLRAR